MRQLKKYRYFHFITLALILGLILANTAWANPVWWEGRVTQSPWSENGRQFIKVNDIPFSLMDNARVYELVKGANGSFIEKTIPFYMVTSGSDVKLLIQGHRIHQVMVLR